MYFKGGKQPDRDKLSMSFADLGEQVVKNISRAVGVFGLTAKDIEGLPNLLFLHLLTTTGQSLVHTNRKSSFARPRMASQLAYSRMGQGPPIVKTGNWMTHLEFDFESPIWRHLYWELSRDHTLFRYDARGNGLSDREVPEVVLSNISLTILKRSSMRRALIALPF